MPKNQEVSPIRIPIAHKYPQYLAMEYNAARINQDHCESSTCHPRAWEAKSASSKDPGL